MEIIECRDNFGRIVRLPKAKFKLRPSVYGLIKNQGKILVLNTRSSGLFWFPGGGVESGETNEQALRREIIEETGITDIKIERLIDNFKNYFYYEPTDEALDCNLFFYECSTKTTAVKSNEEIADIEVKDLRWVAPQEIRPGMITDLNDKLISLIGTLSFD